MKSTMPKLILTCFHARTNAHLLHLQTKSYAQHKALEQFYEEIVPLTDKLAEAYQGDYGVIETYPTEGTLKFAADGLTLMESLSDWIERNRAQTCDGDDTYLQNIIDEIVALIRGTQYKLKNLS